MKDTINKNKTMIKQIEATISQKIWLTPDTLEVTFALSHAMNYNAGQFISIHFEHEGQPIRRSYSIANADHLNPTKTIVIVLTVLPDGLASQFLKNAPIGTTLMLSGPYGALILPEDLPQRLFLVATGTGVAPYRNMLPVLKNKVAGSSETEVNLLFGVRTRQDVFYANEFRQFAEQHPWFHLHLCLSRDEPVLKDEYTGYVQKQLSSLKPDPNKDLVYLCGNPNMVDETARALMAIGFSPRQIKREKYVHSRR